MTLDVFALHVPRDVDPNLIAPALDVPPMGQHHASGTAVAYRETFLVRTRGVAPTFFDITDMARGTVQRAGVTHGQVLASAAHTTCALIVQENEPLMLADLADRLCRFASNLESYRHNDMHVRTVNVCGPEECANGHSHCQHALLGASVVLPVADGELLLGRWQRLLLVELDHPRTRELTMLVTGIATETPEW